MTGNLKPGEYKKYLHDIQENPFTELDHDKDYMTAFRNNDVLVGDFSSILIEYIAFGKPIIYCGLPEAIPFDEMLACMYLASSWEQVTSYLDSLENGIDPLAQRRCEFAKSLSSGGKSGEKIIAYILDDYAKGAAR